MKRSRNWLEMPHELMANIFQRLRTSEMLKSVRKVCTTWRTICKNPEIWKVINIHKWRDACYTDYDIEMLIKKAVDLSRGELTDISIGGFCSHALLDHIMLHSRKLKRLSLSGCYNMTGCCLTQATKKLPQLEELALSGVCLNPIEIVIAQNCPQLKSFKLSNVIMSWHHVDCDKQAVAIAKYMTQLRQLQIYGEKMTNVGFQAILNGCPHLESLHIHMSCGLIIIAGNLVEQCTERIKDFKHNSTQQNDDFYEFPEEEYALL